MRQTVFAVILLAMAIPSPALAGGSWMHATQLSYQPGDHVHAVGYVGATVAPDDGPFVAKLNLVPVRPAAQATEPVWLELGPVRTERTRLGGYLSTRVSIEFDLPTRLEPGHYEVIVQGPNGRRLGDLIGMGLAVGIEPTFPMYVEWPLDEPRIAELPADAVIAGPGFEVVVADLRQRRFPAGAAEFMLNPNNLVGVPSTTVSTAPAPTVPEATYVPPATTAPTPATTIVPAHASTLSPVVSGPAPDLESAFGGAGFGVIVTGVLALGALIWGVLRRRAHPPLGSDRPAELDDQPDTAAQPDPASEIRTPDSLVSTGGG